MTVISMSHKELHRLRVVMDLVEERLTAAEAAAMLGLPGRTVRNRLQRGIMQGIAVNPRLWLVSRGEIERWREVGRLRPGRNSKAES